VLSAPIIGLDPNTMSGVLLFAFAAAAFGGFNSMLGAVLGGVVVGISQNLGATYVPAIGHDLDLLVPFLIILVVLLVKPTGLLRRASAVRV
jgi:branched-chain amino acid transport system permease protein